VDVRMVSGVTLDGAPTCIDGQTALHCAACFGIHECCYFLLKSGASPTAADVNGRTPLHLAAVAGQLTCLRLMLSKGDAPRLTPAQVNAVSGEGWSPFSVAAYHGSEKSCALLMEYGADLALRTRDGFTPLQIAQQHHPEKRELHALLDGSVPPSQCGAKCDHCGKASADCRHGLNVCFCEGALSCGKHCQLAAWGDHQQECNRLREAKDMKSRPQNGCHDANGRWVPDEAAD